jgi:hypothetical protein
MVTSRDLACPPKATGLDAGLANAPAGLALCDMVAVLLLSVTGSRAAGPSKNLLAPRRVG